MIERIYKFLAANYGSLSGTKFKMSLDQHASGAEGLTEDARAKLKDVFNQILQKEI